MNCANIKDYIMNKNHVHDLVAPIGNCKQACISSFRFHYIMNFVHDLQLRSHAYEQARIMLTTLSLYHNLIKSNNILIQNTSVYSTRAESMNSTPAIIIPLFSIVLPFIFCYVNIQQITLQHF
jgi:hypothetical protein